MVTNEQFPYIHKLMVQIFGDQIDQGYIYMKVLYEHPTQILPVLCLVSQERQTGKTTFLNFLHILFGQNYVLISPSDLASSFNHIYALKNIIAIDETVIEKKEVVEKIKAIATQRTMVINQKFVSQYSVPFYGKIVIATNMVKDFMRIDPDEIRFWVRKIPTIDKKVTDIETKMISEIPYFLRYLIDLPAIDFSRSRMVFTADELQNEYLEDVKKESYSGLRKGLELLIAAVFENDEFLITFEASLQDIKDQFFKFDNQFSRAYIRKVLRDEMKYENQGLKKYHPFKPNGHGDQKVGRPYLFKRCDFVSGNDTVENEQEFTQLQAGRLVPF